MIHDVHTPDGSAEPDLPAAAAEACAAPIRLHVAYLINQYPKVSHSFIRREIHALEAQGVTVDRIAIRGWDADLVDRADIAELGRTRHVLRGGFLPLVAATLRQCVRRPRLFLSALGAAFAMSRKSERPLPYHLIYFAQACLVLEWVRESGARHVHAHFGTNSTEVAMLTRLLGGPPYSFTAHGPDEADLGVFTGLDRKVRHAAFVAAISAHTRSQLLRRIAAADWHKVQIVHCGIETAFHAQTAIPPPPASDLVCVARISADKGQLLLLEAMQLVRTRHPNCRLVLVGDGEMRREVEDAIRARGLVDCVTITGWLSSADVRAAILAARALVLPSFQEGLPVVIMEAMALERPVISTYVAGIPELVRHGKDGWLVPAGDVAALVEAMEACLAASSDDIQRMGAQARARALSRHAIDREAAKLVRLFRHGPSQD